jgi:hypothetical protein
MSLPLSHAVSIPSPRPHPGPLPVHLRSGSLVQRGALGHAGLAVFGIAMALASREPFGALTFLRWALLLPATF